MLSIAILIVVGSGTIMMTAQPATTQQTEPVTLRIWLPDTLIAPQSAAAEVFAAQMAAFEDANPGIRVETRYRAADDAGSQEAGGQLYALRTGAAVAPAALPDLVLLRRADGVAAFGFGVLLPLDALTLPTPDLPEAALALRSVADQLLFVPYTLHITHLMYPADRTISPGLDEIVRGEVQVVFAGGRAGTLPDWFIAQYADAIAPIDEAGEAVIEADRLRAIYTFYQQAVDAGGIAPQSVTAAREADVLAALTESASAAIVGSTGWLAYTGDQPGWQYAPLPTLNGDPITVLDGWSWALTTRDGRNPARLAALDALLTWMLEPQRQIAVAAAAGVLPAGRAALRLWEDDAYAAFVTRQIENAVLPPDAASPTTRALGSGLTSVLAGERTAAQAVRDVLSQLSGR